MTCSPEKPARECLVGITLLRSIFISLKADLQRISAELPVSIKIRCILWLAIAKLNNKASVCWRDTHA
jgi:hypothetical protein